MRHVPSAGHFDCGRQPDVKRSEVRARIFHVLSTEQVRQLDEICAVLLEGLGEPVPGGLSRSRKRLTDAAGP
jgi:hypothetical protein